MVIQDQDQEFIGAEGAIYTARSRTSAFKKFKDMAMPW